MKGIIHFAKPASVREFEKLPSAAGNSTRSQRTVETEDRRKLCWSCRLVRGRTGC